VPADIVADMTNLVRLPPAPPPAAADPPEGAKTVEFSGTVHHTDWSDLPISMPMPDKFVWHASRSEVRRRGDACRQVVRAWGLGSSGLVRVEQSRPLSPTRDGRLAPDGRWKVVSTDTTPVGGLVRLRYAGGTGSATNVQPGQAKATQAGRATSVHEVLPAELRRLLDDPNPEVLSDVLWPDTGSEVLRVLSANADRVIAAHLVRRNRSGQVDAWNATVWRATPSRPVSPTLPARRGLRSLLTGG